MDYDLSTFEMVKFDTCETKPFKPNLRYDDDGPHSRMNEIRGDKMGRVRRTNPFNSLF